MAVDSSANEQNGSALEHIKEFDNIRLVVSDSGSDFPAGKLTITQIGLTWTPSSADYQPWTTKFVDVSLHAISTDETSGYPPCIYAQFGDDYKEFRLIPAEDSSLQELYEALCEGAEKNEDEDFGAGIGALFGGSDTDQVGLSGAEGMPAWLGGMLRVPPEVEELADDAEAENGTERDVAKSG